MKLQTPVDPALTKSSLLESRAPLHSLKPFEIGNTFGQVERILDTYQTDSIDFDPIMISTDPYPLYPEVPAMQVVDQISFADANQDEGDVVMKLFPPLLHQNNKRNLLTDSYEPIAVGFYEQTSQNVVEYGPPTAKKFKNIATHLTLKSHQCEDLQNLCRIGEESLSSANHFRSYQSEQWMERYRDLCVYQQEHGHCLVDWKISPLLAQWVKRQRYQSKLKSEGRHTTLTDERLMNLASLGFVWDSHQAIWEERCSELRAFHQVHGHANVPSKYTEHPHLAVWVKGQRRHYSLYQSGKRSCISKERATKLNRLGFTWNVRRAKKVKLCN
jgi:hypothetical protein